jgi:hypothetical protein
MKPQINSLFQKASASFRKRVCMAGIALICIASSAFAAGDEANSKAASSLKKEFKNAENIQWKVTPDYIKASFKWNRQDLEVFYNNSGENIAVSRYVDGSNLPLRAQQYINDNYAQYRLAEAIEYASPEGGDCFYVSLVKDGNKKILKISADGEATLWRPER